MPTLSPGHTAGKRRGRPDSPARVDPPTREPFRIGLVQERWYADPAEHEEALASGVRIAAGEGARLVCLQELTLSPYFAITAGGPEEAGAVAEELPGGPTAEFAARVAAEAGVHVHASLYERAPGGGLGFNRIANGTFMVAVNRIGVFPFLDTRRPDTYGPLTEAREARAVSAASPRVAGSQGRAGT